MKKMYLIVSFTLFTCLIIFWGCGLLEPPVKTLPEAMPIQNAKVDPAFSTTHMEVIGLLPFSNAVQYEDSYVLYRNLVGKFNSKHPQYKIISPEETLGKISSAGLSDNFNVFLGDYTNTGVANPDFLIKIKDVLNVDAVLFGEILAMGSYTYTRTRRNIFSRKLYTIQETENRVGIRLSCFRGKDGRLIWEGRHIASGKQDLNVLADALATIFANYFGRRSY